MVEETQTAGTSESERSEQDTTEAEESLATNGYIERTILHHLAGSNPESRTPSTVGAVLPDIAEVIKRGEYANIGPNGAVEGTVRKSAIRRAFTQLDEKGLVQRVDDLDADTLQSDTFDFGTCTGDPSDPASYSNTADDARVTNWVLTEEGLAELSRLDARYRSELDELAARYGRLRGETTTRIDA